MSVQGDGAVLQIAQPAGELFSINVNRRDGESDLKKNHSSLLSQDPTIELVVLSPPHKDHTGEIT
jgi:hypothetical protein